MAITPGPVVPDITSEVLFIEFGVPDPAVILVLIICSSLIITPCIPVKTILVASEVREQRALFIISAVACQNIPFDRVYGQSGRGNDIDNASQGIAPVDQGSRSLRDLDPAYAVL